MLMEHETLKLKQHDEEYNAALKEWKAKLEPRKQVMWLVVLDGNWALIYKFMWITVDCSLLLGIPLFPQTEWRSGCDGDVNDLNCHS